MGKQEHMPLPWEVKIEKHPWQGYYVRGGPENDIICATPFDSKKNRANADFIILATNNHDTLLKACTYARNHFRATDNPTPDQVKAREWELIKVLRIALMNVEKDQ